MALAPALAVPTKTSTKNLVPEAGNAIADKAEKGVVEEVISKRLKALTKKIIRIKTYSAQPHASLNADQKAALVSLPSLEAVARELEELIKPGGPVETAELTQSAQIREAKAQAESRAEALASDRVADLQSTLAHHISRLLRLHTLWQSQSDAGDIRAVIKPADGARLGRLYDDLVLGGSEGKAALDTLATQARAAASAGSSKEEDISSLLDRLDRIETSEEEGGQNYDTSTSSVVPPSTKETVDPPSKGTLEEIAISKVPAKTSWADDDDNLDSQQPTKGGLAFNFLQEDEVAAPGQGAEGLEDYEVVPNMLPHETSGQQPPLEPAHEITGDSPTPTQSTTTAAPIAEVPTETETETEAAVADTESTPAPAAGSPAEARPAATEAAQAEVPLNGELTMPGGIAPVDTTAPIPTADAAPSTSTSTKGKSNGNAPRRGGAAGGRPAQVAVSKPKGPIVDADGFEQVGKGTPAPRGGFRGRGGVGAGRGSGGSRGRGGPRTGHVSQGSRGGEAVEKEGSGPKPHGGAHGQGPKGNGAKSAPKALYKPVPATAASATTAQ